MTRRLARGPRFVVEILPGGSEAAHSRQRVGVAATQHAAMTRMCEVVQQWALAEGAIAPGTKLSLVDTEVGQEILTFNYLGYSRETLSGGMQTWDALAQPKTPPTSPR